MMRGYERIYFEMYPVDGSRKFAFTIELVSYLKQALSQYKPEWLISEYLMDMLELAMEFGIYFLLRKSEYLPCDERKPNGLAWKNITFFDYQGKLIPWTLLSASSAKTLQIKIGKSKTDQNGIGRIRQHHRVDGDHCIVKKVSKWAIRCRDSLGMSVDDFLFKKNGQAALINGSAVSMAMKFIVQSLGWNPKKISPHSLRYGGATMLAAAGLPQYVVEYFDGWAQGSKSLRVYAQQLGSVAVTYLSNIMSAGFNVSIEESRIRAFANAL